MKQALCAEAIRSLFLVMTVVGSGIMANQLPGGIDGLALIGNTLATRAMLVVLITILGLSLGHISTPRPPIPTHLLTKKSTQNEWSICF